MDPIHIAYVCHDFNRDSVPDLVSFYLDGIEFQTNTVAREPGALEVTTEKFRRYRTLCR